MPKTGENGSVENAIKVKYQPQKPEMFSAVSKEIRSQFVELQHQNSSIGKVKLLMSGLQDKNHILNYLDIEEKKRAFDERIFSKEKLRSDSFANCKDVDEEDITIQMPKKWNLSSSVKCIFCKKRANRFLVKKCIVFIANCDAQCNQKLRIVIIERN